MRLYLLFFFLLPYSIFSDITYKWGEISLNGYSGFNFIESVSKDSINFTSPTLIDRGVDSEKVSIYLGSPWSNLFIDKREEYMALSIAEKIKVVKSINLQLSSTYSQGELTPVIHHTMGLYYKGSIETNLYYSNSFSQIHRSGNRYLISFSCNNRTLGADLILHKSDNFISAKQKVLKSSRDLLFYNYINLYLFKIENKITISSIEDYYERRGSLKITLKGKSFTPYMGYKYKDLDKDGTFQIKHSIIGGLSLELKPNLKVEIDGDVSYINSPFYTLDSKISYEIKKLLLSPYLKLEKVERTELTPGIKLQYIFKRIKSSIEVTYHEADIKNWEFHLNISSEI